MKSKKLLIVMLLNGLLLAGCQTRSISNSGYNVYGSGYQGELSELALLGGSAEDMSEDAIRAKLQDATTVGLKRGDNVLLVQSGAAFPDAEMNDVLDDYFKLIPLTGVPEESSRSSEQSGDPQQPLLSRYRSAAAGAGAGSIIVYWGVLESGTVNQATKAVSWVPVAGNWIPDQSQNMRIQVKAAVIDVASGKWRLVAAPSREDTRPSAQLNRESSDQKQVALLKQEAYLALAQQIAADFSL